MKMFNLNSRLARRATATLALGLLLGAQTAMACTVDNWNGGNSGNVTPGGPDVGVARYSGLCAMQTADSAVSYVQDDSPGGIDRIRARFYVFSGNTADSVVYRGVGVGGAEVFRIVLRASGAATLSSGGVAVSANGNDNAWNSVEIDWNGGTGDMTLSLNGGAPQSVTFSSPGPVSSVRMGNLNGAAGTMYFDAYESRRTTEIGRLCEGETSGDGTRTNDDVLEIFAEVASAGTELANGQPDFTEDGELTNDDVLELFEIVANAQGECP